MTSRENPFTSILKDLEGGPEAEAYERVREARLAQQITLLRNACGFDRDGMLEADEDDPRHSLIFLTRPSLVLQDEMVALQDAIIAVLTRVGGVAAAAGAAKKIWKTPRGNLHMTLLDILSCVSSSQVDIARRDFSVSTVMTCVRNDTDVSFVSPKLMMDKNALAVTFLPSSSSSAGGGGGSHLGLRQALFDGAVRAEILPKMRYVALSAHVTLIRFKDDLKLTPTQMSDVIDALTQLQIRMQEWHVRKEDVHCVYGQVFYGGGHKLPLD